MELLYIILTTVLNVAWFFVVAHLILSWLIQFQVLNINQPAVAQIWYTLRRIMEPVYAPIRRMLPDFGAIDLSPLIVLILLQIASRYLAVNAAAFG